MKTSSLFLGIVASCIIVSGCKKETTTPPPAAKPFIPLTVGTNWTYISTEGGSPPVTFTLTVTAKDTSANSRVYKVIANSAGANSYMADSVSNHYRLASFPTLGIPSFVDLYLKDDKAVNDTWTAYASFSFAGFPLTATLTYTIKDKGAARTVGTKNFTGVSQVRLDVSVSNFGAVGGGDFYYAREVGMIESNIAITPPAILGVPNYSSTQLISAYEIK